MCPLIRECAFDCNTSTIVIYQKCAMIQWLISTVDLLKVGTIYLALYTHA